MIHHVVLLKWKPGVSEETVAAVTEGFSKLADSIDEIAEYSFGKNMALAGSNFDYALIAKFNSLEEFERYTVHPEHQNFMDTLTTPIVESYGAVQYV